MDKKYPDCAHLKKEVDVYFSEEHLLEDSQKVNALPLFEKHLSDLKYKTKHSLVVNEQLRCRWRHYVEHHAKSKVPIILPKGDMHFKNHKVIYDPDEIPNLRKRKHMTIGPGYDIYGEMPMPNDMHIRKTINISKKTTTPANPLPTTTTSHKRRKL